MRTSSLVALLAVVGIAGSVSAQQANTSNTPNHKAPSLTTSNVAPGKANLPGSPANPAPRGGADGTDACIDATPIGDGTFAYDLNGATNDWAGSCGLTDLAPDVWFVYTASTSGTVIVNTCGLANGDSVLAVIDECGGFEIACNDDFCGLSSQIAFLATAGEDYYIRVAGFNGNVHTGGILIGPLPPCVLTPPAPGTPEGEICGSDTNGGCNSGVPVFGTIACGDVVSGTAWADANTRDTDWYDLTLSGPTTVTISAQAQFPVQILILDANCPATILGATTADRCNIATLTATVSGSARVFVSNSGFAGNPCGADNDYWVSVDSCLPAVAPANDNCASAEVVPSGPATVTFDNTIASTDGSPDALCLGSGTDQINADLWYIWQANCTGNVIISTCGLTTIDSRIAVYDNGTSSTPTCPTGAAFACNDDVCGLQSELTISAVSGNYYLIRLGTFPGAAPGVGAFSISDCTEPCTGIVVPPGATAEAEECGGDANGGCNATPNAFVDILCNDTISGTSFAGGATRDTDWYRFAYPTSGTVSFTVTSDFPAVFFILDIVGTDPCGTVTLLAQGDTRPCETETITATGTPGATGYLFVSAGSIAAPVFEGVPCPATYFFTSDIGIPCTGNPCPCDFNQDTFLNSQDFFDFLVAFFSVAPSADFNNDTFVNSQDFFDFLVCFFSPPAGCP